VAYPAAAAVGWARIASDHHWLSDVVAGAALGAWGGREIDLRLRRRANVGSPGPSQGRVGCVSIERPGAMVVTPSVSLGPRTARVGAVVRF
jgi:membrane-associated phospholipid phosphatase